MKQRARPTQTGYALLIVLIVMMGLGGIVLNSYSRGLISEVEVKKAAHNKRVLEEAKLSVLQYAYNRPIDSLTGRPGRILCPDIDNNGVSDFGGGCKSGSPMVGRLPWKNQNLGLYEAKDADGQQLWFAVSEKFAYLGSTKVNSTEPDGTIPIYDQTGKVIYTGSDRVAAVIIAPGKAISRDNYLQDRSDDNKRKDVLNYLEKFAGQDNKEFDNGNKGFILGPIYDAEGEILLNDQIIYITAQEVREVAEKATLQAYQEAIRRYQANIGSNLVYPWLDDYTTIDLNKYDADIGTTMGRVPSIFGYYFSKNNQRRTKEIISELELQIILNGVVWQDGLLGLGTKLRFETDYKFRGDLTPKYLVPPTVKWFWDEISSPDGWEQCPVVTNTYIDCRRDDDGDFYSNPVGKSNETASRVLKVEMNIDIDNGFEFRMTYASDPVLRHEPPTGGAGASHAKIFATFPGNEISFHGNAKIEFKYELDTFYKNSFDVEQNGNYAMTAADSVRLGMRYYPELPYWVAENEDDWHDSVLMAYAPGFAPGGTGNCTPGAVLPADSCLSLLNVPGETDNKIALLVLARQHGMTSSGLPGYADDLDSLFDPENANGDKVYDAREAGGNDWVLVLDEL